jgi:hypothetical protein
VTTIDELTNQLTDLKNAGEPDFQLSPATRDSYVRAITTFRDAVEAQKKAVLDNFGDVGGYGSAHQMKAAFINDAHGPEGLMAVLDEYTKYLDELSAAVAAACNRLIAHDGG